jgi:cytochrome P450
MEMTEQQPQSREYPDGLRVNLAMLLIALMLPKRFPFDPLRFMTDNRKYGDITYYRVGPLRAYQVNSPELIRQILVDEAEKFHKPRLVKRALQPVAGSGLLTNDGNLWKQQRKLIQPAFQHKHLAEYAQIMVGHAERAMESFRDGEIRRIDADMTTLTLGIVVKALFGADFANSARETGAMLTAVLEAADRRLNRPISLPAWVPTRRNLREKRVLKRVEGMLRGLIEERRAGGENRSDLLSVLLRAMDGESGERMRDRQLRDEMMTLFLAGHETTATALAWTWYLLSQHPEVEEKLIEELSRVLGGRAPTATDSLSYADMVIREALRLYPPAPQFARESIENVNIGGYEVRRGSLIVVSTYSIHHDERFFTDPERFNPERFAAGWEERIPRYAYLPFGGGPRVCIGNGFAMMEARLILATMAQRWQFVLEPGQEVVATPLVTLRPRNGIRMKVRLRRARVRNATGAPE